MALENLTDQVSDCAKVTMFNVTHKKNGKKFFIQGLL